MKGVGIRNIKKDIEQLENAGELLDKNSPTAARLSLFLLDNLAELMMYKAVRERFSLDDLLPPSVKPPKYSANKKRKVLEYFKNKVNFLVSDLRQLDSLQGHILRLGHRLRNEAYHKGILREKIIIPITRTYFQTVCALLPILWTEGYSCADYSEVTDFLSKYGQESKSMDQDTLREICQLILEGRECEASQLSEVISHDLVSRIEETIKNIDKLALDIKQRSAEEILKFIQFQKDTDVELGIVPSREQCPRFWEKVDKAFSAFHPKAPLVTLKTLETWKKKAQEIKLEASHGVIFAKFNEIDIPFLMIENCVSQTVFEYDKHIDLLINS